MSFTKKMISRLPGIVLAALIAVPACPNGMSGFLAQAGKFVIVMAMASIGLNTNLVKLLKSGTKPILLGLICWFVLSLTALGVQYAILKI